MKFLTVFLVFISFISIAYAEDAAQPPARDSYYSSGYIFGLNLGQAWVNLRTIPGYKKHNTGFSGRVYFGYNINHYASLQIGYLYLPKVKYTQNGQPDIKVASGGFNALMTLKYPIGEGFALYGNLGGALFSATERQAGVAGKSQNATVLAYGGGLDYSFANIGGLHMVFDYLHTDKKNTSSMNVPSNDIGSVGVYYQF